MPFIKENSPFTPGSPVPVELFVGRKSQIDEIMAYLKQSSFGRQEHIFLIGERGIGKSSLASFLKYISVTKEDFLAAYISLGGVEELDEVIRRVIEQILREINNEKNLKEKFASFFKEKSKYIRQVGLFGVSLSFNPPKDELQYMVRNFPDTIKELWDRIKDRKRGIFLVLDDINGVAKKRKFPNWYKSFVDNVAVKYMGNLPISVLVIGLPEVRDELITVQPSLMRVFRTINIDRLKDEEVEEFFKKAFKKAGMKVEKDAMKIMVEFSSGLPILMHEIGDAVFWKSEDEVVDEKDALYGILEAAERVGKKYLDPKVYRTIRSERYRSILRKLGKRPLFHFKKKEIERDLNESEKKVFHNFLRKMRELGVITQDLEKGRGSYKFVNMLYPVYIWMESQRYRRKYKGKS